MDTNPIKRFSRHMPAVEAYGQRLAALQNVWDSLSLLSQMNGDGANMGQTREAFESLSRELVNQLSAETSRTAVLELRAKAQVAIDIMVRNLFERTADIGFLCTDDDIVRYAQDAARGAVEAGATRALRKRLQEYVAKYSVYQNVVLLGSDGTVLVQLDEHDTVARSSDPLIAAALNSTQPYVERYGVSDLAGHGKPALIYAYRVQTGSRALGVLCLCFRFDDEAQAIFDKLRNDDDWTVLALLDPAGRVIASSDHWQLPIDAPLTLALQDEGRVVRFAGREYLAVTRPAQGYQGYLGPGWLAHAMVPLEHAFERRSSQLLAGIDTRLLADVHRSADIFSDALRAIPQRAESIQHELNQAVWNGSVKLVARAEQGGKQDTFSKSLLREISATGRRTQEVFEQSIGDLHETVVAAIVHDSCFRASLAVEIMDRNLYERANDCRWWALNGTLRNCLMGAVEAAAATQVLEHINNLYTVYDNIMLFDRHGRVIAASNPQRRQWCGTVLTQPWVRETLALRDTQAFAVSAFAPLDAYEQRPTYVFTAAVRGNDGGTVGGIAIVFDSQPQLAAMLRDAVSQSGEDHDEHCCAMLLDEQGAVIAATARYAPGDRPEVAVEMVKRGQDGAADIVTLDGAYYAVGARRCAGYREFGGVAATAVVMTFLGTVQRQSDTRAVNFKFARHTQPLYDTVDIAAVSCGEHWIAIRKEHVVEAIGAQAITRVPGRAPWLSGVMRYQAHLLPVIDLAYWLDRREMHSARQRAVIVVRHDEQLLGVGVDGLGEVLEISRDEIGTIDALNYDAPRQLTPQLVRPRATQDVALLLLDIGALVNLIRPSQLRTA